MDIKLSKRDAMHILNWLNEFKRICRDHQAGMDPSIVSEIKTVRKNLWDECEKYYSKPASKEKPFGIVEELDDQVAYNCGNDFWWVDPKYARK